MTQPQPSPRPFTVLVAGGRRYFNLDQMTRALDRLNEARPITLIVHGDAAGADTLSGRWAQSRGIPVQAYPPSRKLDGPGRDWKFRRNTRMLKASAPDLVVAFPGGPGTDHNVRETKRLGFHIWDLRKGPDAAPLPAAAEPMPLEPR